MAPLTVAVLGLGEAGSAIAGDLVVAGVAVRGFDPALAEAPAGVELAADAQAAASGCDVALSLNAAAVAMEVAESAARLGATVTVCNRTKRHADRLAAAGARVVDLARLVDVLPTSDVAIFGTAAPHRLLDAERLAPALTGRSRPLLVLDLCVPRNVDPDVGTLHGARLVDLDQLRAQGAPGSTS